MLLYREIGHILVSGLRGSEWESCNLAKKIILERIEQIFDRVTAKILLA